GSDLKLNLRHDYPQFAQFPQAPSVSLSAVARTSVPVASTSIGHLPQPVSPVGTLSTKQTPAMCLRLNESASGGAGLHSAEPRRAQSRRACSSLGRSRARPAPSTLERSSQPKGGGSRGNQGFPRATREGSRRPSRASSPT